MESVGPQEQLNRLAAARAVVGERQVLPLWWYLGWTASYLAMLMGMTFMWQAEWAFPALYVPGLLALLMFGRWRQARQGVRVQRMRSAPLWREVLVWAGALVVGGGASYVLLRFGEPWLLALWGLALAPLIIRDMRRAARRQAARIGGGS